MYYTYVLLCKNKDEKSEMYVGFTNDLRQRVSQHKAKGVKTTKKFDAVAIVYYEACLSKKDALKRELQLKTGFGRGYLKRRLESYIAGLV